MYRNTYVEIYLKNIENNVKNLIKKCNKYKYYFGVVKANCYSHGDINVVKSIIKGGCNYLCVATLDEALEIRKEIKDIPILCLGVIPIDYINECESNNIAITINSLDYFEELIKLNMSNLKVHIKINTGMNRLGINNKADFNTIISKINKKNIYLEGIYTHIYDGKNESICKKQDEKFLEITSDIDLNKIPIVHLYASDSALNMDKPTYANGCRFGIAMYGLTEFDNINFLDTFSLYSEIIQINNIKKGETVGYNGEYKTTKDEIIGIVPIGYADGIIRKNTGRFVYIKNKPYKIVGNICMDMLFVKINNTIKLNDKVQIIKDINHIKEIANYTDTIPYEVLCNISKRVPRIYK